MKVVKCLLSVLAMALVAAPLSVQAHEKGDFLVRP